MKCPRCHSPHEESQNYCRNCGNRLRALCPGCSTIILPNDKFCGECGLDLEIKTEPEKKRIILASERKLITSLFVDISAYTSFSENLDPEEIKDLISTIFGEIARIIIGFEGHIASFANNRLMALFGMPQAHEDDPIRALKTATEIHQLVRRLSLKGLQTTGHPLWVQIGINTGLTLTGHFDFGKVARNHFAGDAVNVASRLCSLAQPGETLVGQITYEQAMGFFDFAPLEPLEIEGKALSIRAYRVVSVLNVPHKRFRNSKHRSVFIGRNQEMTVLAQALARIKDGNDYAVVAVAGEAGTGKSRLIEEFRASLKWAKITWMEGYAFPSTQNISYFPLIDLIKRDLVIEEEDTPGLVAGKLESRLQGLGSLQEDVTPFLGALLSLHYPAVAKMSPEFWRLRFYGAIPLILQALARQGPVVICFEDLHWADAFFLNFLRGGVFAQVPGVMLLYSFRPPLEVFSRDEISLMGESYQEIQLQDLSEAEIQEMLASILQTTVVPEDLRQFIRQKVGTNPFYVEEMINSLIEAGMLQPQAGTWRLTRAIEPSEIPSSIQAVIYSRIDRLSLPVKNLLQEASVIGKTFPYDILRRITGHPESLNEHLNLLEELGLLRRSAQSEREYEFKHALIQEAVYSGLLKEDRLAWHQQIGLAMEEAFSDRLPEFYETLAFHFRHSSLHRKAIAYLRNSGRKSLNKYAVQESHEYYQMAFQILEKTRGDSEEEKRRLIDFLNEWGRVFYYRGDFGEMRRLFLEYQKVAESLSDEGLVGSFYVWFSISLFHSGRVAESFEVNLQALEMCRKGTNTAIDMGYANIIWCCAELNLLEQGRHYGEAVLAHRDGMDPMGYVLSLGGLGMIYIFTGDSQKNFQLGRELVEFGDSHSDLRSTVVGYICTSYGHYSAGDFTGAVEWSKKAVKLSNDPIFSIWPRLVLANYFVQMERFQEAQEILREIIPCGQYLGMAYIISWAQALQGIVWMAGGHYSRGMSMVRQAIQEFTENGRFVSRHFLEFSLAEIYFQMATSSRRPGFRAVCKNVGFFLKEAPFAKRKATYYLQKIIREGEEMGARGFMQRHAAHRLELLEGRSSGEIRAGKNFGHRDKSQ